MVNCRAVEILRHFSDLMRCAAVVLPDLGSKVDLRQVSGGFAYSGGEIANCEIANGEIENGEIENGEIANGEYNYESAISTNPPAPTNRSARVSEISVRLAWNPVRISNVRQHQVFR